MSKQDVAMSAGSGMEDGAGSNRALPRVLHGWEALGGLGLFAGLLIIGWYSGSPFTLHLMILGCLYAILVMSQNLVIGYMGLLHLGHAAFFGIGAYGSAVFVTKLDMSVIAGYAVGVVLAAIAGLIVGGLSLRFGGHYLAIVSLGFGVIVYQILNNWVGMTRGPMGLTGIPGPADVGFLRWTPLTHLATAAFVMVATLLLLVALRRSKLGLYMNAVREDLIAAQSLGIDTTRVKVAGYTLAAAIAGLAGALFAHYREIISPESFTFLDSATLMAMAVLGGLRSYLGSIAAAFFLIVVPELLRGLAQWRLIIYGALLVVVVLYFPKGLAGLAELAGSTAKKVIGRGSTPPDVEARR